MSSELSVDEMARLAGTTTLAVMETVPCGCGLAWCNHVRHVVDWETLARALAGRVSDGQTENARLQQAVADLGVGVTYTADPAQRQHHIALLIADEMLQSVRDRRIVIQTLMVKASALVDALRPPERVA